ncbi:MAG TPA: ATP-binding cassette domain-containing protein, partial [Candidatus Binatia bacterium]|nr:ATP-binding cassette domain-containing protein [Candidatus Binatia bacterium]
GADGEALREVSLAVEAGEVVSVAGRNGAGKSTLALAAAGLLPRVVRARARGSVRVGERIALADGRAGEPVLAGLVLADPATGLSGARASVREEVAFGLENLGVARAAMDPRIDAALDALGIGELADRPPEQLSGGEQQRVAIAAAVAMAAPLFVLDEASAELDPPTTRKLAELLPRLATHGIAVLAADHAPAILRAGTRTLVLDAGSVAAELDPASALDHPALAALPAEPVAWRPIRSVPAPSIELLDVTYRYPGGTEALRGVRLSIDPGEAVAIVGQNGSGKSTLAKLLVGLLRPTGGRVLVDGREPDGRVEMAAARSTGLLLQDPREQLFGRTVEAAVAFGPRNLGLPAGQVDALVDSALATTGLAARRTSNPHDLDHAARKLAALAGVLAMDPGLYLLDEPTTGQDRPGLARAQATIAALRAAGRTIVAITHDLDLARRSFDRVVELRAGEVVADGPPGAAASKSAPQGG